MNEDWNSKIETRVLYMPVSARFEKKDTLPVADGDSELIFFY